MRTSQEIRDELKDIRNGLDQITDGTEDVLTGWIEALEWVLSDYVEEVN